MVRSHPPHVDPIPEESSSSSGDSSIDSVPRSISSVTWTHLPPPRANPVDDTSRKWMSDRQPVIRPFCLPPSSGDDFFMDSLVSPSVRREEAVLFHEVAPTPSHTVEDVHVLLKLPLFGDFDLATSSIDNHIIERAKVLKAATLESAKYSREFLTRLRSNPLTSASNSKTPPRNVSGTGNVLPPEKRKVAHESLKYTFATWIHYFFSDTEKASFHPGVEGLHRIYKEDEFQTRNIHSSRSEGVFDIWGLIICPQVCSNLHPPYVFVVPVAGGAFWPFSYRPDRVCRQFGLDQPPRCIKLASADVPESMKAVFFKPTSSLPSYDAKKFIPPERAGRILDVWIAYYARLKNSVKHYESQDSMQHFTNVQIMFKNLYYATTTLKALETQEHPRAMGKKRKPPTSIKGKRSISVSCEVVPPSSKRVARTSSSVPPELVDDSPVSMARKPSSTHFTKVKKEILLPTRASARLRAKPKPCATSSSSTARSVSDGKVDQMFSEHASTPSNDAPQIPQGPVSKAISTATPTADGIDAAHVEVLPLLSSLLSAKDAYLLSEFSNNHAGFRLLEYAFPPAFLKPTYTFFVAFLRFFRAHPCMELLSTHKDKIVGDLKALRCFGFQGEWLDSLFNQFERSLPAVAFEDLQKSELARLNAKCKDIDEAHAGLDVDFRI
ncbi:hypothetical protein SESBI_24672 [Sesbania bispinosa]|nr:hypothetical protein SESBI_24672 [Sesbania bispinosa]